MAEDPEFTVRDRRTAAAGPRAEARPKQQDGMPDATSGQPSAPPPLPEMDFAAFVITLASTAQMSLGAIPNPETNEITVNLPAAKQMIDILGLMQDKTKGNLSEQESALLEQVLFNLRTHYLRTAEGQKKSGG